MNLRGTFLYRAAILLFWLVPVFSFCEKSLDTLISSTGSQFSWDPYSSSGVLYKNGREVRFSAKGDYLLFDGTPYKAERITRKEGEILFPDALYSKMETYLKTYEAGESQYKVTVILIDPGHGGKDWGAYYQYKVDGVDVKLKEKNINLDVSHRIADILRKRYPGKEVRLTRDEDYFITLQKRVDIAEEYDFSPDEGMVFVSIHTNASLSNASTGFEVWYLPDSFKRDLVNENENELNIVLNTMWGEVFKQESYNLSRYILNSMDRYTGNKLINRGLKQNDWYMLTNQNMVSCLVELAFITNRKDAGLLMDTSHLKKSSSAIAEGIGNFIEYFESQ